MEGLGVCVGSQCTKKEQNHHMESLHDRILTNLSCWRRSVAECPLCPNCDSDFEDSMHAIRGCPTTRNLWSRIVPQKAQNHFFSPTLSEWIAWNLEKEKSFGRKIIGRKNLH